MQIAPEKEVIHIIKKDGTKEDFNFDKIVTAVKKSAERVMVTFTDEDFKTIHEQVLLHIGKLNKQDIDITEIHNIVEKTLESINPQVSQAYKDYRNYKQDFVHMLDKVYQESQRIMYIGDKSNANADSTLSSTKRSLIFDELGKELYRKFFLTKDELQAVKDGYIYTHDANARLLSTNCCIADIKSVLSGGFEMGNIRYTEPKTLDVAFNVISDIVMSMASQQYGGYSIGEVDKILEPYAEKSYKKYIDKYVKLGVPQEKAEQQALEDVERDFRQGVQGWELAWNTVNSARGSYIFISCSFGLGQGRFAQMATKTLLNVRKGGQGVEGNKKPVLFPKLIFLYDENVHGEGKPLEELFNCAIECSKRAMYPDYESLSGTSYLSNVYQTYGTPITSMGCVKGTSTIVFKHHGIQNVLSFTDFWNIMAIEYGVNLQPNGKDFYIKPKDLEIYDTKFGFTKVYGINRNTEKDWRNIVLSTGHFIETTYDHLFTTENKGDTFANNLQIGDKILTDKGIADVIKIEQVLYDNEQYSYDVTTESEHFEVNGIYSHNCRSFLSPWFERGGIKPVDENDKPVYVGRGNIGVISLNLPMIYMKSLKENKDFYEVLDYYLEMIRQLHIRTFNYLGEMKASVNPIGYCEGGFFGGHLQPDDKVKPVLKSFTTSFGITALNELQELYNQKSIVQDGEFALKTMKYIADKVEQFKQEDGILHSCYGVPAESLCGTQVKQFRQKYGIIENVSDREYMTNSFHCHVSEDITPIQKQDYEERFWDLCKGGQIQYTRFYNDYNTESFKQIIRRGMKKGFYSGVNLKLSYCEECGHEELGMEICPKCGSKNITTLDRICGYVGFSRINSDTRMNKAKMEEIHDRKSM